MRNLKFGHVILVESYRWLRVIILDESTTLSVEKNNIKLKKVLTLYLTLNTHEFLCKSRS